VSKINLWPVDEQNINSAGFSRTNIINTVRNSLKRLRTGYVDLLLLNGWDETVDVTELVRDMDQLARTDKIRYFGVSDMKAWQAQKIIDVARMCDMHRCVCYAGEYNLLTRGCEWEVKDVCKSERIGFLAYAPLKYGLLTDKFREKTCEPGQLRLPASMGHVINELTNNETYKELMRACREIGEERNWSVQRVALMWTLQSGFVTSMVVSVSSRDELDECMRVVDEGEYLTYEEMERLEKVSSPRLYYPYHTSLASMAGSKFISQKDLSNVPFEQLTGAKPTVTAETIDVELIDTWHELQQFSMLNRKMQQQLDNDS
jgi:aryl-alcohol dehydrogenase-like predicted oxidoreductase